MKTYKEFLKECAEIAIKNGKVTFYEGQDKSVESVIKSFEENEYKNRFVPVRYRNAWPENKEVIAYIDDDEKKGKGLYIHGTVGTGKTYELYGIFRFAQVLKWDYYAGTIVNFPNFLADLRKSYNEDMSENIIDNKIKQRRLLFIDDFGTEKITDWNIEILYRLINFRYENELITFFASNLSMKDVAEKYGDRIASRIVEMCRIVKMNGKDRRFTN